MLSDDLRATLGSWRTLLPTVWRGRFDDVELPFEKVPSLPGGPIWPQNVFRAFRDVAPSNVRAVIFGNDPYTQPEQATGRSFEQGDISSWKAHFGTRATQSLKGLMQAVVLTKHPSIPRAQVAGRIAAGKIALPSPKTVWPSWGKQGVLWLNTTLTFTKWDDAHRAAHRQLWAPFTARVLRVLVEEARERPVAFVLWGVPAKALEKRILRERDAVGADADHVRIVKAGHPVVAGFFGNGNPLTNINAALGRPAIKWLP